VSKTDITISAGADLTMAAGRLERDGTVTPSFDESIMTVGWANIGHDLPNQASGPSLKVDFPVPTGDYKDYTFEFGVTCDSCNPSYLTDRFTARIAKNLFSSVTIQPSDVSIDLDSTLSQAISFSAIILPEELNITSYRWSEDATNPASVLDGINTRAKTITISSWPKAGQYQINVAIESPGGNGIASTIVQVTGTGSGIPDLSPNPRFPSEDDLYNVDFFLVNVNDENLIEPPGEEALATLEDIPVHSVDLGPYEISLTCANPSVCVIKNSKLTALNEPSICIAYQAFYLSKWQIYLRQIRLSDQSQSFPQYEYPYSRAGFVLDSEIDTYNSGQSNVSIDTANSKIYYSSSNTIRQSDYDGSAETTLYTYSDSDASTTDKIGTIELDLSVSPQMIYFARRSYSSASSVANLMRAQLSNISGTLETIATISTSDSTAYIGNIAVSQDYVWWYGSDAEGVRRKNKNLSGSTTNIALATTNESFVVDYNANRFFIFRISDNFVYEIALSNNVETSILSVPFTLTTSTDMKIDSVDDKIYLSDPSVESIVRFNYDGTGYETRVSSTVISRVELIDSDNDRIYWTVYESSAYSLKRAPRYFNTSSSVLFYPCDFYTISIPGTESTTTVTRVIYEMQTTDGAYKLVRFDKYGYYNDIHFIATYDGDLSPYWYNKSIFEFTDSFPNESGSNLSNYPFSLATDVPYSTNPMIRKFGLTESRWVANEGSVRFVSGQFGACGAEVSEPVLIAASSGHCTRPKICSNYNGDLVIAYEDSGSGRQQIKIRSTGDLCQNSPLGSHGSYVSSFIEGIFFNFYHDITTEHGGINQLADVVVDKNNIVHIVWQSNRDQYWEVYYANSTNSFDMVRVTNSKSRSMSPSIDINDDGKIYVTFHDDRFGSYEVFVAYQNANRILPLFEQDEYLAGLRNDYDHYMDVLSVPVVNSSSIDTYIHVVVRFYDNRIFSGDPVIVVSTQDNPELFQFENESAVWFDSVNGLYVLAGSTEYLSFLGSTSGLAFQENQTYFIKLQYIYYDGTIVDNSATSLSYSCTRCNQSASARWASSGSGFSDTRITFSTNDSLRPAAKVRSSGKLLVLWEDYRFDETGPKILGSIFDSSISPDALKSSGGSWFDYDYNINGQDCKMTVDLFDRVVSVYEKHKKDGERRKLSLQSIGYKVCDFLVSTEPISRESPPVCDYSSITTNVLTDDPNIASQYVKQLDIMPDYVDYYTRNAAGDSIPIVSNCAIKIEMLGTPEVVAYRIKNENETRYSEWIPFKPEISNYLTQINHILSPNAGIKEVCVEVATYSGVTASFSLYAIADYDPILFDIVFTTVIGNEAMILSNYESIPVASANKNDSLTIHIWIKVDDRHVNRLTKNPTFDFVQQGMNDLFGVSTERKDSIDAPENPEEMLVLEEFGSGTVYKGTIVVYSQDGQYNKDGLARIKPRFESECILEYYSLDAAIKTRDIFNDFGRSLVDDQRTDNLSSLRDSRTGRIGIRPDIRDLEIAGIFSNWLSVKFDDTAAGFDPSAELGPYIDVHHTQDLPIWRSTGYTISFWVRANPQSNGAIVSESGIDIFSFLSRADGKIDVLLGDQRIGSTQTVCDNMWHNVIWIDDDGTAALYVDGEVDETNFNYSTISSLSSNSQTRFGSIENESQYMNCFKGYLDEVAAWNVALSPDEVSEIYGLGCPTDLPRQDRLIFWNRMGDSLGWRNGSLTLEDESSNNNYATLHNGLTQAQSLSHIVPCKRIL